MPTKGYLILAQNNSSNDYVRMAYVLALSIKNSQKEITSVSLITDVPDAVPNHYKEVFDHIIEIPWYDDALNSDWKIENRWKIYHITPYDETVLLDADMLFLTNVDHWWGNLSKNYDLFITSNVMTYRNETVTSDYYRKAFVRNNLPNTYSAFTYFKKTEFAEEFWTLVEVIVKNWKEFYDKFLPNYTPKHLSIDIAFALAVKILDIEDRVTTKFDYPTFVHMKSKIQNWFISTDDWMDFGGVYLNRQGLLKISNYQQTGIFHYTEKKFLTKHIEYVYEDLYKEKINGSR
jgi:hypothetical protein